jgi:glycerol uptake facilitator-like aquaporin
LTTVQIIANPAVTVGWVFSDTFAGIAPVSAPGFIAAQILGGAAGLSLVRLLFPAPSLSRDIPAAGPDDSAADPVLTTRSSS